MIITDREQQIETFRYLEAKEQELIDKGVPLKDEFQELKRKLTAKTDAMALTSAFVEGMDKAFEIVDKKLRAEREQAKMRENK